MSNVRSRDVTSPAVPGPAREEGTDDLSLRKQLLRPRTLVSFGVSLAIVVYIFSRQQIPFGDVLRTLRSASPLPFLLAFVTYYSSFLVRSLRWRQVLRNAEGRDTGPRTHLPFLGVLRIIFISWFANAVLPVKLGDAYRGYLLKRWTNTSFSRTLGTIVAERILDVGALFTLLLISGAVAFHTHLPPRFVLLLGLGGILTLIAFSALFALRFIGPFIRRLLPARAADLYGRLETGVLLAFKGRLPFILALTLLVWALESATFGLVARSLGTELHLAVIVFLALSASLLTTVPFTPAGLGIVEGAVVAVVLWVIPDGPQAHALALSIALLFRSVTYWSLLVSGAIVYMFSFHKS